MRTIGFVFGNSAALKIVLSERYILNGGKLCENDAREKNIMTEIQTRPRVKNIIVFMNQSLSYQLIFYHYFLIKEMAQSFSSY
jgi:hypothetical protein